jgi:hypothetical protein
MSVNTIFAIDLNPLPSLNPLHYIQEDLNKLFDGLLSSFQKVFIHPPHPTPGNWEDYLYGNAIGLAGVLSVAVCVTLFVLMMVFHQKIKSFGLALLAAACIGALYPAYFAFMDFLIKSGDDLAQAMHWYKPHDPEFTHLPAFGNILGSILGIGSVTVTGGTLIGIFAIYELIIIVVKFFTPIAIAMGALGDRSKKFLSWLISLGLVTMVFGRAFAIFAIDTGRMVTENLDVANNGFIKTVFITVALLLAIILQGVLIWLTHKVTNNVVGRTYSRVFGQVESLDRKQDQMGLGGLDAHLNTKGAIPVMMVDSQPDAAENRSAINRVGGAVIMKAASAIHPAAGVAAAAAAKNGKNGSKEGE